MELACFCNLPIEVISNQIRQVYQVVNRINFISSNNLLSFGCDQDIDACPSVFDVDLLRYLINESRSISGFVSYECI